MTPSNLLSKPNLTQLTILHTNEIYSHIHPFVPVETKDLRNLLNYY